MEFQWPSSLALLVVVAALAVLYIVEQRRRQRYALRYASLQLVREAVGPGPGIRRHIPPVFFLLGFAILILALARPATIVMVPGLEGTVILAIDISGSMLADDVKPTRFEAAKAAAKTFVERQRQARTNIRVGIVGFSDDAQLVMAPSLDRDAINNAIDRLKTQKATAIGRAIIVSLDAIFEGADTGPVDPDNPDAARRPAARTARPAPSSAAAPESQFASAAIVVLTDGENNVSPPPLSIIDEAVSRGIRVYTVGVGTPEGALVTNQGRSIRSELDEETLKKISEASHGKYFNAQSEQDLQQIYTSLATELVLRPERSEITVVFAAVAAALLLLAASFSLLWFNRLP